MKPTVVRALSGYRAFQRLDQRRHDRIEVVVLGTTPHLQTARLLALRHIKSYRGETKSWNGLTTLNGHFLFDDGTGCIFVNESFIDGRVRCKGQLVFAFVAEGRPDCPVRLAFSHERLLDELTSHLGRLSESDRAAVGGLVAERTLPAQSRLFVFDPLTHLAALEYATLVDLRAMLRAQPCLAAAPLPREPRVIKRAAWAWR